MAYCLTRCVSTIMAAITSSRDGAVVYVGIPESGRIMTSTTVIIGRKMGIMFTD